MRYLIDQLTKNALTIAKNSKFLRKEDEFRVYDPDICPIEGFDVKLLTQVEKSNYNEPSVLKGYEKGSIETLEGIPTYSGKIKDSRNLISTLDFDKALEWCDCYVCFESIEHLLASSNDIVRARQKGQGILDRLNQAIDKHKKVYLGHRFDSEFKYVIDNYDNCINEIIGQKEYEEMITHRGDFFLDADAKRPRITLVVGTSSASGKFSTALEAKAMYEKMGEVVSIIETEETFPLFSTVKNSMYGFCRNFSDLTLNQEALYLQGLIGKITSEMHSDRIIICTQSFFGFSKPLVSYINENVQLQNVGTSILLHAIGADNVIISSTWENVKTVSRYIKYFRLLDVFTDAVFISPVSVTPIFSGDNTEIELEEGIKVKVSSVRHRLDVAVHAGSLVCEYPNIPIICNYMGITSELIQTLSSDYFKEMFINRVVSEVVSRVKRFNEAPSIYKEDGIIYKNIKSCEHLDFPEDMINKVFEKAKELNV